MTEKTKDSSEKSARERKSAEEIAREDAKMVEESYARPGVREAVEVYRGWQDNVENPESVIRSGKKADAS